MIKVRGKANWFLIRQEALKALLVSVCKEWSINAADKNQKGARKVSENTETSNISGNIFSLHNPQLNHIATSLKQMARHLQVEKIKLNDIVNDRQSQLHSRDHFHSLLLIFHKSCKQQS